MKKTASDSRSRGHDRPSRAIQGTVLVCALLAQAIAAGPGRAAGADHGGQARPADRYLGRPLPFLDAVDLEGDLSSGTWTVLFFERGCPDCALAAEEILARRKTRAGHLAFVEIPSDDEGSKSEIRTEDDVVLGRLRDKSRWEESVPLALVVRDGLVADVLSLEVTKRTTRPDATSTRIIHVDTTTTGAMADLGYVEPESLHRVEFLLRNAGTRPVRVKSVRSECACTTVERRPEEIGPGGKESVVCVFSAPRKPAEYRKRVRIETDQPAARTIALGIAARCGLPLRVDPRVLDLGVVEVGREREAKIVVRNDGPIGVRLLYATSIDRSLLVTVPRGAVRAKGKIRLRVTLRPAEGLASRTHEATARLRTNARTQRDVLVRVRYRPVPHRSGSREARTRNERAEKSPEAGGRVRAERVRELIDGRPTGG